MTILIIILITLYKFTKKLFKEYKSKNLSLSYNYIMNMSLRKKFSLNYS